MMSEETTTPPTGITAISVSGFKSLRDETRIEVRPLTVLAGANSSGKSSIIQPLLLMKQTLESPYELGALSLSGANAKFTLVDQFLSRSLQSENAFNTFSVELQVEGNRSVKNSFQKIQGKQGIQLSEAQYTKNGLSVVIRPEMTEEEIYAQVPAQQGLGFTPSIEISLLFAKRPQNIETHGRIVQRRCFLDYEMVVRSSGREVVAVADDVSGKYFSDSVLKTIHISGLRSSPQRSYMATAALPPMFPGLFETYVASVIHQWQSSDEAHLQQLYDTLGSEQLRLTSQITTRIINDVEMEILVGRTIAVDDSDLVNIHDVGVGVSQVLPVLVALLVAEPGQLVYIEQPELHLHPRAQHALAQAFVDAANRGVRVVVETHSDLFLLGIQTQVAKGELAPEKVIFHWFERDEEGVTKATPTDINIRGAYAYSDFPEDFAVARFEAQGMYIDAAPLPILEPDSGD